MTYWTKRDRDRVSVTSIGEELLGAPIAVLPYSTRVCTLQLILFASQTAYIPRRRQTNEANATWPLMRKLERL